MLKKHGWIAALFVAVAMVFMACPPPDEGPSGGEREEELYWTLTGDFLTEERLDAAAEDDLINGAGLVKWEDRDDFFAPELAAASSANTQTYTVVANGENKALEINNNSTSNWGVGIDLQHSFFDFHAGDTLVVTGKVLTGNPSPLFINTYAGYGDGTHPITVESDGSFSKTVILEASDITSILSAGSQAGNVSPQAIRIGAKPEGIKFVIHEIEFISSGYEFEGFQEVENITSVELQGFIDIPLELGGTIVPASAAQNRTIVWSKATTQDADNPATFEVTEAGVLTATTAGIAIVTATVVGGIEDGDYTKNFTIQISAAATGIEITVGGTTRNVTVTAIGAGTVEYLPDGSGYIFAFGTSGYQSTWAKFSVNLGANELVAFESVKYSMLGEDSGTMASTDNPNYKNTGVLAGAPLPASFSSNPLGGTFGVTDSPNYTSGQQNIVRTIDSTKAATVSGSTIEVSIYVHAPAGAVYTITNIEFVLGEICDDCSNFPCTCSCSVCGEAVCECILVEGDVLTFTGKTIDSSAMTLINTAKENAPKSVVKVTVANNGSNGAGFGFGHYGSYNLTSLSGATFTLDVPVTGVTSNQMDYWSGFEITAATLWVQTAP